MKDNLNKHEAEHFIEILESKLKIYAPFEYATKLATILNKSFEENGVIPQLPPHRLLHSIEFNCVFFRNHRDAKLNDNKLISILNHYNSYKDPLVRTCLNNTENGLHRFLLMVAHQQFYCQTQPGTNDLGRGIQLFQNESMQKMEHVFVKSFGITYQQYWFIGYLSLALIEKREAPIILLDEMVNDQFELTSSNNVERFLELVSITPEEIKQKHCEKKERYGKMISSYETYFQSVFLHKPLLNLGEGKYLVVHKGLLWGKIEDGIFDLAITKIKNGAYGNAFGEAFEKYVGRLLVEFQYKKIINEKHLKKITSGKVCDYLIVEDDYLFIIECKATAYRANMATENALKNDNSTKKIAGAIQQIAILAEMIRAGDLNEFFGDVREKKMIASVVTYKNITMANSAYYWNDVICHSLESGTSEKLDALLEYRPQILSIDELEKVFLTVKGTGKNCLEIFKEKLNKEYNLVGDWTPYLNPKETEISLLSEHFNKLIGKCCKEVFPDADLSRLYK